MKKRFIIKYSPTLYKIDIDQNEQIVSTVQIKIRGEVEDKLKNRMRINMKINEEWDQNGELSIFLILNLMKPLSMQSSN